MTPQEAKTTIEALADGLDPESGEILPRLSVFNNPQVIRSLFVAARALEAMDKKQTSKKALPQNAGKPWSEDEDKTVMAAFSEGRPVAEIAAKHERTNGSIASRLVRLGCIVERQDAYRQLPQAPHGVIRGKATPDVLLQNDGG